MEYGGKFVTGTERGLLFASLARATWAKHGSALNCDENFTKFQEQALFLFLGLAKNIVEEAKN